MIIIINIDLIWILKIFLNLMQSNHVDHPHNSIKMVQCPFICQRRVNFGEAVFIIGNTKQLGGWSINHAKRLDCYFQKHWIIDIDTPIDTQIQYKYFVWSYHHFQFKDITILNENWIGDSNESNFRLFITERQAAHIQQSRKDKKLKIMSFNIRYQNDGDRDELHWLNRRQNNFPSVVGVQQACKNQKLYLKEQLRDTYNYVGVPRDNRDGQQVGIFYDRQRFILVQYGFRWISQSGQPGSVGFGSTFPRYFTFIILEDTYNSQKFRQSFKQTTEQVKAWIPRNLILIQNVHLDHWSFLSQRKGIQMMANQLRQKSMDYKDQIRDAFVFGDFNVQQTNQVFHKFSQAVPKLQSIRQYFARNNLKDFCDYKYTFNGFEIDQDKENIPSLLIDHMFVSTANYIPLKFQVVRQMIKKPKNPKHRIISDHFPIMATFNFIRNNYQLK